MKKPKNPMLWTAEPNSQGYDTSLESLEAVLRQIDCGRVDLARALVLSMIGVKLSSKENADA